MLESPFTDTLNAIKDADLPAANKIARAFDLITTQTLTHFDHDIDLSRALHDQDKLIQDQIKRDTLAHAREIFNFCYRFMLGGDAWDV
ncbi:MAG TPA: hypothetical protein VHP83_16810 [Aggregatilineaceae bacterium]|nr:hypothetical protein [Aggregatilineaceae bacterium]